MSGLVTAARPPRTPAVDPVRAHAGPPVAAWTSVAMLVVVAAAATTVPGVLGVTAAAGAAVAAYLWLPSGIRQDAPVLLFAFLLYTNALVVASRFHGVPVVVSSASVLLLAAPAAVHVLVRRSPVVVTPALPLMFLHLAVLCLAAAFARDVESAQEGVVIFLTEGVAIYVLLTNAVRSVDSLRRVLVVLIVAAALLGLGSVWQEVTGGYDNTLLGFAQTNDEAMKVGEDIYGKVMRDRLGGPLGSPNRYAQILVFVLPFALYEATRGRGTSRVLGMAAIGPILAGILLTFSRGAVVAMGGMVLLLLLMRQIRWRQVVVLTLAIAALVWLAVPDYASRLVSLEGVTALVGGEDDGGSTDGAIRGRATSNLAAVNVFLDNPALGVGPLQYFAEHSQEYANDLGMRFFEGPRRAHNLYLEIAADTGVVGLLIFLAIPAVTLWRLRQTSNRLRPVRPDLASMADALTAAVVAYLATGVFLHLSYQRYYWLLIAVANVGVWVLRPTVDGIDGRGATHGA